MLDLRSGHHTLIANEGTRAVLARAKSDDAAGFRAEAPRIEVENDSQTFVMAGAESWTSTARRSTSRPSAPAIPTIARRGSIRFETSRDVRISPGRASFLGDVTASSSDKGVGASTAIGSTSISTTRAAPCASQPPEMWCSTSAGV